MTRRGPCSASGIRCSHGSAGKADTDTGTGLAATSPGALADSNVDAARRQRWVNIVGADHWSVTVSGWMVLAVNAQLLGSGLDAEAAQWSWLEEQAGRHRGRQPVALITHKPVTATGT